MTISTTGRASAYAQDTDEVWLVLLTIDHANIDPSVRVVNNTEAITSRSNEYVAFPFDITLPDSREGSPPAARLAIDNVSREIAEAVRTINTPADVTIEIIRASAPDTVEASFANFKLRNVTWNAAKVSGELTQEDFTSEPYPAGIFSPASFPGLFAWLLIGLFLPW